MGHVIGYMQMNQYLHNFITAAAHVSIFFAEIKLFQYGNISTCSLIIFINSNIFKK